MTRLLFICSLAVALQFVSCQQPAQLTESQRAAIKDSVIQMSNRYVGELRANHIEAALDCYDDSPEFFWVLPPDTTVISHDALVAMFKVEGTLYRSHDMFWDYMRVEPLTNQYAVFTGRFHVTVIDTSSRVHKFKGVGTAIVVHGPNGWKFLSGQTYEVPLKNE